MRFSLFLIKISFLFVVSIARSEQISAPSMTLSPIREILVSGDFPKGPEEQAPVAGQETVHVIESGDNPWTIAKKYGVSMEAILEANQISNTRKLQIGQKLKIPSPSPKNETHGVETNVAAESVDHFDPKGYEVYTIRRGDNPWTVARKLKVDYDALLEINDIENPRDMKVGQKLRIPHKDQKSSAPAIVSETGEPFDADGHEVYIIKNGDNPWTIAKKFKIDYEELVELNQIKNPRDLKIGQKLKLPKKADS